jgi:glycosyltransferase involved in cell wall biosynthesis
MSQDRLKILYLAQMPPSPPRFGAQARMHGLMTQVARRHDLTAVALADGGFDAEECARAMRAYCRDVVLVPNASGSGRLAKRWLQARSLASRRSFERHLYSVPALQPALDRVLRRERFDLVNVEFPYLAHLRLRQAPVGVEAPALVLNAHEIAHDLARQIARHGTLGRRIYGAANWRKLRGEEHAAFRAVDGIYACSADDEARVREVVPGTRTAVIPNAADVDLLQPRAGDPPTDGRTVLFFGLLSTVPNMDAVRYLVQDLWPRVLARRPDARCRIVGAHAPRSVLDLARPSVEIVGFVEDLRPHLASAAAVVVPLRIGGGTRLKIVEAMAAGKAIVSTTLGAEGIRAVPEREILIADEPPAFADAVCRLLDDAALAARVGRAARQLAVERYSWSAAASALGDFFADVLAERRAATA